MVRNRRASSLSFTDGASSRVSTRRASWTVHSDGAFGHGVPVAAAAALRKPMSNRALCATRTAPCGELEERREDRRDRGRPRDHRGGDAGEMSDVRRDPAPRIDQGGELAQHLAAAHLHGADLRDRVAALGGPAGGLQVDHHERDVAQVGILRVTARERLAIVEGELHAVTVERDTDIFSQGAHGLASELREQARRRGDAGHIRLGFARSARQARFHFVIFLRPCGGARDEIRPRLPRSPPKRP